LVEDRYVADWEQGYSDEGEILQETERLLRRYDQARESRSPVVRKAIQPLIVEPTAHERDITDALRQYMGAAATKELLVQKFRREDLPNGKLLTRDEQITDFLAV